MMNFKILTWIPKSLWHRRSFNAWLLVSFVVSSMLIFSSFQIRDAVRSSFQNVVSDVDLVIGGRTSEFNLIMFSLFHLGQISQNLSAESVERISQDKDVNWVIPISKGDSYRGFPVVGTNENFLKHFRYARSQALKLQAGEWFQDEIGVVIGSELSSRLGLGIGDEILVSHGLQAESFDVHDDHPFQIVGVLQPTGTPIDKSLYVSLSAIEHLHPESAGAVKDDHSHDDHDHDHAHDHEHSHDSSSFYDVSALLVQLKSRQSVLGFRSKINQSEDEAMTAAMPGQVLQSFWMNFRFVPSALGLLSFLILFVSLISLTSVLIATFGQRRREFSIVRSLGFRRIDTVGLFVGEAKLLCFLGAILGWILHFALFYVLASWVKQEWGLVLEPSSDPIRDLLIVLGITALGAIAGFLPFLILKAKDLGAELQSGQ